MTQSPFSFSELTPLLSAPEVPRSRLQEEIEFLGAQELIQAFRNLEAETALVKPGTTVRCCRMAIAPTDGPNGEIYKVIVSVVREVPHATDVT